MKIVFFIDSLQGGGAARVMAIISNELVERGHKIYIATNTAHRSINYKISSDVTLIYKSL
jgi:hypothetical protein